MKRSLLFLIVLITTTYHLHAQDSTLLNMLSDSMQANAKPMPVRGTFKGLYIVNMKTVESSAKGALNFLIMHRFGKLNDGAYNFFGLDNASIRLGLDYGITDRLAVGIGRSSLEKTFDGYFKYRLLWQSDGSERMPLSLSVSGGLTHYTLKYPDKTYLNARYRTSYVTQLIAARKFNSKLSLQLVPMWIHYNLVPTEQDKNNVFAIDAGGRMRLTNRMSITAEYNYLLPNQVNSMDVHNSLSFAWEIETGGHVFQLVFTNSQGMTEPQVVGRTMGKWGDGDIYFGFNISRVFNVSHKAKKSVEY
jgi:hypothetical protein